jgi:hypothetical protein
MGKSCTYCGSDVEAHEPVFVEEEQDGTRVPAGQFCNYACLARHIEDEGLETGTYCQIDFS